MKSTIGSSPRGRRGGGGRGLQVQLEGGGGAHQRR